MKKNIPVNKEYMASALSVLMVRNGITELTFTKEEYEEVFLKGQYIKLQGEFQTDDAIPDNITFTLMSREEYVREMH
jgi:hypothetical protein